MKIGKLLIIAMGAFLFAAISGFCLDNSIVVDQNGNVGIGTASPVNNFSIVGNGTKPEIVRISGPYPPVSSNGYRYYKQFEVGEPIYNIPSGVIDNGYRIGMAVQGYVYTPDFAGTLQHQFGAWIRTGVSSNVPSGRIYNSYALYLENLSGPNVTIDNSYGIFQIGSMTKNYFQGNIGIGTVNPEYNLDIIGTARVYTLIQTSDERMKTDIAPVSDSLTKLSRIRGISYKWKDQSLKPTIEKKVDHSIQVEKGIAKVPIIENTSELKKDNIKDRKHLGLLAQEVEQVFPEAVYTDKNGVKGIAYSEMIGPMIEGLKELMLENAEQQKQLTALQKEIEDLKRQIKKI